MLRKLVLAIALIFGAMSLALTPKPASAGGLFIEFHAGGHHGNYQPRIYWGHSRHYRPRYVYKRYHQPYVVYRPRVQRYRYVEYHPACEIHWRKVHRHGHWVKRAVRVCYSY